MSLNLLISNGKAALIVTSMVLLPFLGSSSSNAEAPFNLIRWPLGRSGEKSLTLQIPPAFNHGRKDTGSSNYSSLRQDNGQFHAIFSMAALWPGLQPEDDTNHAAFAVPGGGSTMRALVFSGAKENFQGKNYDALQSDLDIAVEWSTKHLCVAPFEQLPLKLNAVTKCYPRSQPDVKTSQFGLQRLGVDFNKYPDIPEIARGDMAEHDIYYLRDAEGELVTVITCDAEEMKATVAGLQYTLTAQCRQSFISKRLNALLMVDFRRVYLKDWREIRASWIALIESFIVSDLDQRRISDVH